MQEVSVVDSKASILLDHNKCTVGSNNRVTCPDLALPIMETKWKYSYSGQIEFTAEDESMCRNLPVVHATSCSFDIIEAIYSFLLSSDDEVELDVCAEYLGGTCGTHGINYRSHRWYGSNGQCGRDGYKEQDLPSNGSDGKDGGDGNRKGYSGDGGNGEPAPNVKLILEGSKQSLFIHGSQDLQISGNFNFLKGEQLLLINCRGGKGGYGVAGEDGGGGGDGGNGGDSYHGDGADGGHGGHGGNGGEGGDGGNSGDGGNCIIQSSDPALFKLIEVDCRSGEQGRGGSKGEGGYGGKGGRPGKGGKGGLAGRQLANQARKPKNGGKGRDGLPGNDGKSGKDGKPEKVGKMALSCGW